MLLGSSSHEYSLLCKLLLARWEKFLYIVLSKFFATVEVSQDDIVGQFTHWNLDIWLLIHIAWCCDLGIAFDGDVMSSALLVMQYNHINFTVCHLISSLGN